MGSSLLIYLSGGSLMRSADPTVTTIQPIGGQSLRILCGFGWRNGAKLFLDSGLSMPEASSRSGLRVLCVGFIIYGTLYCVSNETSAQGATRYQKVPLVCGRAVVY